MFTSAVVTPLLKDGLDPNDLNNFRPIPNFSLISKILEQLVKEHKNYHLDVIGTLPQVPHVQSAYHHYHSTEIIFTKVVLDIIMATDARDVSVLAFLDLSSAFDIVDHTILLNRLCSSHHIDGIVLEWLKVTCKKEVSP